jgi:hypothetical protein
MCRLKSAVRNELQPPSQGGYRSRRIQAASRFHRLTDDIQASEFCSKLEEICLFRQQLAGRSIIAKPTILRAANSSATVRSFPI